MLILRFTSACMKKKKKNLVTVFLQLYSQEISASVLTHFSDTGRESRAQITFLCLPRNVWVSPVQRKGIE